MNSSRAETGRPAAAFAAGLLVLVLLGSLAGVADARQFRSLRIIATPDAASTRLPDGAHPVEPLVPLTRAQARAALERVLAAWNDADIERYLGEGFYDPNRLGDNVDALVRRDARLYLQAIQGVQTLQQYVEDDPARPGRQRLVSRVSVTARTQIEFETAAGSFTRRSGINEFLLRIVHEEAAR